MVVYRMHTPDHGPDPEHSGQDTEPFIVYFSSTTNNTHRFVEKLGFASARIPVVTDPDFVINRPAVLIVPTYGGGASIDGRRGKTVPIQVVKFLNNPHNRAFIRGVIASGNTNFGVDYGKAGDIIADKLAVPYLYRFELLGNEEDVAIVRRGIAEFFAAAHAA